jgi:hypothetical protein
LNWRASFASPCGADIRLVPQALQGTLPVSWERPAEGKAAKRRKKKQHAPATIDAGLKDIFGGIGLFIIFLTGLFVFRGAFWLTIWFIIPALASVGEGIGKLIRAQQEGARLTAAPHEGVNFQPAPFAPAPVVGELSSPDTTEIVRPPASVTDVTTRHLDAPTQTR